jgi:hypothetical protein
MASRPRRNLWETYRRLVKFLRLAAENVGSDLEDKLIAGDELGALLPSHP